jgi:hypothetical protein
MIDTTDIGRKPRMFAKFHEINERYKTPRIATSPAVKFALLALRIYLLALVGLLVVKFVLVVGGGAM